MRPKKRHIAALALATAIGACSVNGCATFQIPEDALYTRHKSLTPSDFPVAGFSLEALSLEVAPDVTLRGWRLHRPQPNSKPRAAVLYFGGQGFHLVLSAAIFEALLPELPPETDLYVFDYRGYGRSTGTPGAAALKSDARAIWAYVTARPDVDATRVILHGHSMGSFMASHVASRQPARRVVLENPVTNADDWIVKVVPWWLRLFLRLEPAPTLADSDNLKTLARVKAPTLLAAGGKDPIAPPSMAEALRDVSAASEAKLLILPEGTHTDLPTRPAFARAYRAWLCQATETCRTPEAFPTTTNPLRCSPSPHGASPC